MYPGSARGYALRFSSFQILENRFRWKTAANMRDNAYMKKQTIKKPKAGILVKVEKAVTAKPKLSKADPDYYKKIGAISAAKRKLNSEYFSNMAAKSHNEKSRPDGYHGGRKKKSESAE